MTALHKREWVRTNASMISVAQRLLDVISIFAGLWFVCFTSATPFLYTSLLMVLVTLVIYQMIGGITDFWGAWRGKKISTELLLLVQNWTLSLFFSGVLMTFKNELHSPFRLWFAWYMLSATGLVACRLLIRAGAGWLRRRGINTRNVAIVGDLPEGRVLADTFRNQQWLGFRVSGIYDDPSRMPDSAVCAGDLKQLIDAARAGRIHNVYIALPMSEGERIRKLVRALSDTTCSVMLIPDVLAFSVPHNRTDVINGVPVIPLLESPISGVNRILKRMEDLFLSVLILFFFSPVLCAIALVVYLSSPGPVLFRQTRYGMDGHPIQVWKFRTMQVMENDQHVKQARRDDPRVTRMGQFLRRTSLDEMPQFFNVVGGTMSVVGPRPHAVAHNEQYRILIEGYMLRHKVKPGITGWAQVNGWRGETDTLDKMQKRVEYDLEYIREWSLWFDIKIVIMTIFKGFINKAAY